MLWQYLKLCWSPRRWYVLAFLDWLGGLPCTRRKLGLTIKTCHSWSRAGWDQWLSHPPGVFRYLTEKPFPCIWIWGAVFVQGSVGKTCTLNLNVCMDMRRFSSTTWVVELVPAYSCLFSAFPECWSSATADKVRKLLYYLLKASHNNKIPVWHPFSLILETVNWDWFSAHSLPLSNSFQGRGGKQTAFFTASLHV